MGYRYSDDFSFYDENCKPYNISIEKNSDLQHLHSTVRGDGYHVLVNGNRHFAKTPALKNFRMVLEFAVTPLLLLQKSMKFHVPGFILFFRYDRFSRTGYAVECLFHEECVSAELFRCGPAFRESCGERVEAAFDSSATGGVFEAALDVNDNVFGLSVNGARLETHDHGNAFPSPGAAGLDKTHYAGELVVKRIEICSEETPGLKEIISPFAIELPSVHGMSAPYRFEAGISQYAGGPYELGISLSGGIKDRPERGQCGKQWTHEIDRLRNPYLRLDSPEGEIGTVILQNGLMTLLDREEQRYWTTGRYPQPEWPLRRKALFEYLPPAKDIVFSAGYDYFENKPQIFLGGGPFEAMAGADGKIFYSGPPLREGKAAVKVASPADKIIVSKIPEYVEDRERAVNHARKNHYFFEHEKCLFQLAVYYRGDSYDPGEFRVVARAETVFGETLQNAAAVSGEGLSRPEVFNGELGIDRVSCTVEVLGFLKTGVYRLAVKVTAGIRPVHDEKIVFEVLSGDPGAPSPPEASGLPLLFSIPNEIKYLETDAFDPRAEEAGYMHYIGMSCFYPEYGRKKRIWELLGIYRRKWLLSITSRTTPGDLSIEGNSDIIKHCDYLQIPSDDTPHGRYELWQREMYRGKLLELLIEFFRENPDILASMKTVTLDALTGALGSGDYIGEEEFKDIVGSCWQRWLGFFARWLAGVSEAKELKLKAVNSNIKDGPGYFLSLYVAKNRSGYSLRHLGFSEEVAKHFEGFWQFEDYPYACGYSIVRGTFLIMTSKMHHPSLKIFPEIYSTLLDGCNDGAVAHAHPPFGFYELPPQMVRERIYEYAFAACWLSGGKFRFWEDNGFHFRVHSREAFDELLAAWGNVLKHRPERPVRTACFLADAGLIATHPDYYEENCKLFSVSKNVNNTGEEFLAYIYGRSRDAGLPAGFAAGMAEMENLRPGMADLLVLPPLNRDAPAGLIENIRRLHKSGVNLICSEEACGLEDIFGLEPLEKPVNVAKIKIAREYAPGPGHPGEEPASHKLCRALYGVRDAEIILSGAGDAAGEYDIPVLSVRRTERGSAAFFNIPPTVVMRDSFLERYVIGQECLSELVREAAVAVLNELSDPVARAKGARVIAFYDSAGRLVIAVEEESVFSRKDVREYPRCVFVEINRPSVKDEDISCDRPFSVFSRTGGRIVLRLLLGRYESALITVDKRGPRARN